MAKAGKVETPIKTSELEAAVKAAKTLKESDYTEASWKAFAAAFENAEKVLADPKSQAEVDQAKTVLSDAVEALIKNTTDDNNTPKDPEPSVKPDDNSGTTNGTGTNKGNSNTTGTVSRSNTVKTGDATNILGLLCAAAVAMGAGGVSLKMRGRKRNKK